MGRGDGKELQPDGGSALHHVSLASCTGTTTKYSNRRPTTQVWRGGQRKSRIVEMATGGGGEAGDRRISSPVVYKLVRGAGRSTAPPAIREGDSIVFILHGHQGCRIRRVRWW